MRPEAFEVLIHVLGRMNGPVTIGAKNRKIVQGSPDRTRRLREWCTMVHFKDSLLAAAWVSIGHFLYAEFTVEVAVSRAECFQLVGAKPAGSFTNEMRAQLPIPLPNRRGRRE